MNKVVQLIWYSIKYTWKCFSNIHGYNILIQIENKNIKPNAIMHMCNVLGCMVFIYYITLLNINLMQYFFMEF